MIIDPTMLDPNVYQAAKAAGLVEISDLNFNGKIDIQDVALQQMKTAVTIDGQNIQENPIIMKEVIAQAV